MTDRRSALPAAFLLGGTGAIHLAATPAHLAEATLLGVGFAVFGLAQIAAAALLVTRDSALVRGGAATLQLAAIAAWMVSRTVGLPLVGHAEPVGLADTVTVTLEALSVLVLFGQPRWRTVLGTTAAVAAVAVVSLGGTATAIVALEAGHPHAPGEEHDDGQGDAAHDDAPDHDDPTHDHDDQADDHEH